MTQSSPTVCDSWTHIWLLAWHVLHFSVVSGTHVLANVSCSNLHVCSQVRRSEATLYYFVMTPLDPEISTLPSLFLACLQCSFRCFLHTVLSCYAYIWTQISSFEHYMSIGTASWIHLKLALWPSLSCFPVFEKASYICLVSKCHFVAILAWRRLAALCSWLSVYEISTL